MLVETYAGFAVTCGVAFHWVVFHAVPSAALASGGGLLLMPLLLSLPAAASTLFRVRWGWPTGLAALIASTLFVEWGLSHGPAAFPWPLLGHTQADLDPVRQIADLSGVSTVSAWVLLLNGSLAAALLARRTRWRLLAGAAAVVLLGAAWAYGTHRLQAPPPADGSTRALLVQPALPATTWAQVARTSRLDTLRDRSDAALDTAAIDLVIWPETALPLVADAEAQRALLDTLQHWTAQRNVALLTGGIEVAMQLSRGTRTLYNSAFLITPDSVQRYRKNYLVPFAEHVPLSEYVPALRRLSVPAGGVAGYARSHLQPTLTTPTVQIGTLICFESIFSHHLRAYVNPAQNSRPVDLLVTVAQDGWWGPSAGYRQHLAFSQLHALAVRRAMAFVTVTGHTGWITAQGEARALTGWMEAATRRVALPHHTALSPYVRWGDWLSVLALLATGAFALTGIVSLTRARWM